MAIGDKVGEGKPAEEKAPTPGVTNLTDGDSVFSQAEITEMARITAAANASKTRTPTVSSYDGKNNFQVPLTQSEMKYVGSSLQPTQQTMPFDSAYNSGFLGVSDPTLQGLVRDAAGGDVMKFDSVWKAAVYRASMSRQSGNTDVTVEGLLRKWGKSGVPDGVNGGGGGGGPFKTVNRQVSLTDEGTANQIVNNALTRYLGREASDIEQRAFLKALNVQEKKNATTTVTEGTTSGRNTTSKSTTTGGYNRDDFAQKFAQSQEGYAEYQTATTYLDAFIDSLENPMRAI